MTDAAYGPGNPPPESDFECCRNGEHGPGHVIRDRMVQLGKLEDQERALATYRLYATQEALDFLAETVAGMLDAAMHLEECWISDDETRCVCIVGKLRDAIPRCGHVEPIGVKGLTRQCLSTVHPSAPWKHVFGTV